MLIDIVMILLVLAFLASVPTWSYSRRWGYAPSGGIGLIFAAVMVLHLLHVL